MSSQRAGPVFVALALLAALVLVGIMGVVVIRGMGGTVPLVGGAASRSASPTPRTPRASPHHGSDPTLAENRSPFTGLPIRTRARVLAAKINNRRAARPHTGVEQADLVYVQPVAGGKSRLLAVFASQLPQTLGPIEDVQEHDTELLRQFGEPGFVFAGAPEPIRPLVRSAPAVDLSYGTDANESAYFRDEDRPDPHDLYAQPHALLGEAGASRATDIGFRFGTAPSGGSPLDGPYTVSYDDFTIGFVWSEDRGRFRVTMNGNHYTTTSGRSAGPSTVVIQRTTIRNSRLDGLGAPAPYVETVGSGAATILRNGRAHEARWERPGAGGGTTFTTYDGTVMHLAPGQIWVVYDRR